MTEETFGPVLPVMSFQDSGEAVRLANDSIYGLSAAGLGDEAEALAVARQLNVGAVSINDGGLTTEVFDAEKNAFNLSGLGASRMGPSGLLRFLRKKALLIQHGVAEGHGLPRRGKGVKGPFSSFGAFVTELAGRRHYVKWPAIRSSPGWAECAGPHQFWLSLRCQARQGCLLPLRGRRSPSP